MIYKTLTGKDENERPITVRISENGEMTIQQNGRILVSFNDIQTKEVGEVIQKHQMIQGRTVEHCPRCEAETDLIGNGKYYCPNCKDVICPVCDS